MPELSLKEASAIAEVPEMAVRKAIEARVLTPGFTGHGRGRRYAFRGRDLTFLKVLYASPMPLSLTDKRALWELIDRRQERAGNWRREGYHLIAEGSDADLQILIDTTRARAALRQRLLAYARGRRRIVQHDAVLGGEPVFAGTRIPLAHIVGLLRKGVPVAELREDYPALSDEDLLYASIVARMGPDPGRPRERLAFTRAGTSVATRDTRVPAGAVAH